MRMRSAERGEVDRKREFNGRNSTQHQGCEYFLCSGVTWFEGPSRRAQRRAFESGSWYWNALPGFYLVAAALIYSRRRQLIKKDQNWIDEIGIFTLWAWAAGGCLMI